MKFQISHYMCDEITRKMFLSREAELETEDALIVYREVSEIIESYEDDVKNIIIILRVSPKFTITMALAALNTLFAGHTGYCVCFRETNQNDIITNDNICRLIHVYHGKDKSFKELLVDVVTCRSNELRALVEVIKNDLDESCKLTNQLLVNYFNAMEADNEQRANEWCKRILITITTEDINNIKGIVEKIKFSHLHIMQVIQMLSDGELLDQYFGRYKDNIIRELELNDYDAVKNDFYNRPSLIVLKNYELYNGLFDKFFESYRKKHITYDEKGANER